MTDQPPSQQPGEEPEGDQPAAAAPSDAPAPPRPAAEPLPVSDTSPTGELPSGEGGLAAAFPPDRPERAVGAAFAGGLVLAMILKRLAR